MHAEHRVKVPVQALCSMGRRLRCAQHMCAASPHSIVQGHVVSQAHVCGEPQYRGLVLHQPRELLVVEVQQRLKNTVCVCYCVQVVRRVCCKLVLISSGNCSPSRCSSALRPICMLCSVNFIRQSKFPCKHNPPKGGQSQKTTKKNPCPAPLPQSAP